MSLFPNQIILTNYLNYSYDESANIFNDNGKMETLRLIKNSEKLLKNPNLLFNEDGSYDEKLKKLVFTTCNLF